MLVVPDTHPLTNKRRIGPPNPDGNSMDSSLGFPLSSETRPVFFSLC